MDVDGERLYLEGTLQTPHVYAAVHDDPRAAKTDYSHLDSLAGAEQAVAVIVEPNHRARGLAEGADALVRLGFDNVAVLRG